MRRIRTVRVLAGLFPAIFVSLFFCCQLHAAGAKPDKQMPNMEQDFVKSDSPIHITADRMEAKQDDRTIVFENHVIVTQDDLTITSNRLKVLATAPDNQHPADQHPAEQTSAKQPSKTDSSATNKIDYIEFEGDVKVTQQDRLATAKKAIFYQKEQKVILTGNPVVTKGQDRIEGDLITIFLQQGRSIVEGRSGVPVKALLFPEKKE